MFHDMTNDFTHEGVVFVLFMDHLLVSFKLIAALKHLVTSPTLIRSVIRMDGLMAFDQVRRIKAFPADVALVRPEFRMAHAVMAT